MALYFLFINFFYPAYFFSFVKIKFQCAMVLSSISCFIFGLPLWLVLTIHVVIVILSLAGLAFFVISLLRDPNLGSYKYHRK